MCGTLASYFEALSGSSRLALVVSAGLALGTCLASEALAATPTPYLQDSTIVGSGGTLTATSVPVQTSTGSIVYKDVTIQLNAATNGNLTIAPGYPIVQNAPSFILNHFASGNYVGPPTLGSGKFLVAVSGPGAGSGGATLWSLTPAAGANCATYPQSVTWYTGPIAANPLAARLKKANITSTLYSYGLVGFNPSCAAGSYGYFLSGALVGLSQVGGSLTIVSFTSNNGVDSPIPLDEISYTLLP